MAGSQTSPNTPFGVALNPGGLAQDAAGNVYVIADHQIRRVAPDGTVTTIAGTGECGSAGDGGPAVDATLAQPAGLALTAAGDVLVADINNGGSAVGNVRRVSGADGSIATVAGASNDGSACVGAGGSPSGALWPIFYITAPRSARAGRAITIRYSTTRAGSVRTSLLKKGKTRAHQAAVRPARGQRGDARGREEGHLHDAHHREGRRAEQQCGRRGDRPPVQALRRRPAGQALRREMTEADATEKAAAGAGRKERLSHLRRAFAMSGTMLTALVALASGALALFFTVRPDLTPDPRTHLGASASIFAVDDGVTLGSFLERRRAIVSEEEYAKEKQAYIRQASAAAGGGDGSSVLTLPGEDVFVNATIQGFKSRSVAMLASMYDADRRTRVRAAQRRSRLPAARGGPERPVGRGVLALSPAGEREALLRARAGLPPRRRRAARHRRQQADRRQVTRRAAAPRGQGIEGG